MPPTQSAVAQAPSAQERVHAWCPGAHGAARSQGCWAFLGQVSLGLFAREMETLTDRVRHPAFPVPFSGTAHRQTSPCMFSVAPNTACVLFLECGWVKKGASVSTPKSGCRRYGPLLADDVRKEQESTEA